MVNYLSKFTPSLREATAPLRSPVRKDSEFLWNCAQEAAFEKMKTLIASSRILNYFDANKSVTLEVDTSKHGPGTVFLQNDKPVAYASKSLMPSEQDYAQIGKGVYAIAFGTEQFHQYTYGRPVEVITDHKSLEAILRKPLSVAPPWLQRMMLHLQKYEMNVLYKPGKNIPGADTLSRLHLKDTNDTQEAFDAQVHALMTSLPVSDNKISELQNCTKENPDLQQFITIILIGWPAKKNWCPKSVLPYRNYRDVLTVMNGLVFKGERIVIPSALKGALCS